MAYLYCNLGLRSDHISKYIVAYPTALPKPPSESARVCGYVCVCVCVRARAHENQWGAGGILSPPPPPPPGLVLH
jgi:hypothetical protein